MPVDLRGAGDDVVRMARAVFSDRVRLLWSDTASSPTVADQGRNCGGGGSGGGGGWSWETGRWPSPGPARRPLYIPWRVRHFLAYSRRRTPGRDVALDMMLIQFKEVGGNMQNCQCFVIFIKKLSSGFSHTSYVHILISFLQDKATGKYAWRSFTA